MIDLGKGVSVDFKEHPYVFGIDGWDPIRIQKGEGRITGVSVDQLEIVLATIKGSRDGQKSNNGNVKQTATRKTRANGVRSTAARKDDRPSSK